MSGQELHPSHDEEPWAEGGLARDMNVQLPSVQMLPILFIREGGKRS